MPKKEIESIKTVINVTKEKLNIRLLFQGKIPGILLIGIVIAAFQQWCGLNVVFNYAQKSLQLQVTVFLISYSIL